MRFQWKLHRLAWDLSGGRLGRRVLGMPVLEMETTGHKTGRPRSILISYVETPDGPVVAGTNAGASTTLPGSGISAPTQGEGPRVRRVARRRGTVSRR